MARNVDPVDPWTLTHFVAGVMANQIGMTRGQLLAIVVIYELLERSHPPETLLNRVVDGLANFAGWEFARIVTRSRF